MSSWMAGSSSTTKIVLDMMETNLISTHTRATWL